MISPIGSASTERLSAARLYARARYGLPPARAVRFASSRSKIAICAVSREPIYLELFESIERSLTKSQPEGHACEGPERCQPECCQDGEGDRGDPAQPR